MVALAVLSRGLRFDVGRAGWSCGDDGEAEDAAGSARELEVTRERSGEVVVGVAGDWRREDRALATWSWSFWGSLAGTTRLLMPATAMRGFSPRKGESMFMVPRMRWRSGRPEAGSFVGFM